MKAHQTNSYFKAYLLAFVTVTIWAGWILVTRYGVKTQLSPLDVTFLRFVTAGLLFSPIAYLRRKKIFETPKLLLFLMSVGAGGPYVYLSAYAFRHAEASHGILIPGTMPLWIALLTFIFFKEKFSLARKLGYCLIILGMLFKMSMSMKVGFNLAKFDLTFLAASLLWAVYSIANRKAKLDAVSVTAWVATSTAVFMALPYYYYQIKFPHHLNLAGASLQILYQGVLTSIVALITYNKAMEKLGRLKLRLLQLWFLQW